MAAVNDASPLARVLDRRTRPHARKGASGDDLSPTVWMAVFSCFRWPKTHRRVSVRLASNHPKMGRFWALSVGASNRPVRHTRKGILRVETPGSDAKRIRLRITSPA